MKEKMKSFVKGLLLGLCGHPLPNEEPVAQWETVFEGEATTKSGSVGISACDVYLSEPFIVGDTLRLTVNGISQKLTAIQQKSEATIEKYPGQAIQVYVGNSDIGGGADNGFEIENVMDYDYCLLYLKETTVSPDGYPYWCYFYTAAAGTYILKVERLVK